MLRPDPYGIRLVPSHSVGTTPEPQRSNVTTTVLFLTALVAQSKLVSLAPYIVV